MILLAASLLAAAQVVGAATGEAASVSEKVRAILSADITSTNRHEAVRELTRLGPGALPVVTAEIARLRGSALAAAVEHLEASDHRPAAALIARRLSEPEHGSSVMAALLRAVGRLGGDDVVSAVTAVAKSDERDGWTRFRAFTALVTVGSERATAAAIAVLDATRPARPKMPSAAAFSDVIGRPMDETARERAAERDDDYAEYFRLGRGLGAAKVALPAGRTLLVFPDRWLGTFADLWAQEFGADGRPERSAIFLGVTMEGGLCPYECPIAPILRGDLLTVQRPDTPATVEVDLKQARRDSDADGFTDLVERRLSLDPEKADSDGDGMPDAVDPVPNARTRPPSTEAENIGAAIFDQFYAFTEHTGQPAVFVAPSSQALDGRRGPTLMIPPGAQERARARYPGLPFIRITPIGDGGSASPGERLYSLLEVRGPKNGGSYKVIVRRAGGRWLVRSLEIDMML